MQTPLREQTHGLWTEGLSFPSFKVFLSFDLGTQRLTGTLEPVVWWSGNGSLGKFPAAIHWLPLRMLRLQAGIEQILPTDSCFAPPFIHSPLTDPC